MIIFRSIVVPVLVIALAVAVGASCKGEPAPGAGGEPPVPAAPAAKNVAPALARSSGCLLSEGGCKLAPQAIEPCAELGELEIISLPALLASPREHDGKQVAVRGPLMKSGAECTEQSCKTTCCNACMSWISIGDPRSAQVVRLDSPTDPGLYRCAGDESLVCCQVDPDGREVVAMGIFTSVEGLGAPLNLLWTSELCSPVQAPADSGEIE